MEIFENVYLLFIAGLFFVVILFFIAEKPKLVFAKHSFSKKMLFLIYLSIFLILFAFIAPIIIVNTYDIFISSYSADTSLSSKAGIQDISGPIGDTFGGLVNPFFTLAAVIVTGLAFYVQYIANEQAREHFNVGLKEEKANLDRQLANERQQYEQSNYLEKEKNESEKFVNGFFELLRLHKENVSELSVTLAIKSKSSGEHIHGRRVFVVLVNELHITYELILRIYNNHVNNLNYGKFYDKIFTLSYYLFFEGLTTFKRLDSVQLSQRFQLPVIFIEDVKEILVNFLNDYESNNGEKLQFKDLKGKVLVDNVKLDVYPFIGQSTRLGHYFRHLYFITKYVAQINVSYLSYSDKRYYLRILRNQLSNFEQILLYYNWLSDYGKEWEEKDVSKRKEKSGNYFFTDYRMIHNLNGDNMLLSVPIIGIFDKDVFKNFLYETGQSKSDLLFDIYGIQSSLKETDNNIINR